ncbi:MAG: hypothetical protein ACLFTK_04020 [Anaerolineales bacterium]
MSTWDTWLDGFRARLGEWVMDCSISADVDAVEALPDLLHLARAAADDERLPADTRADLRTRAERVLAGMDYLPEGYAAQRALAQDARRMARTLDAAALPAAVVADHWPRQEPLAACLTALLAERDDPNC